MRNPLIDPQVGDEVHAYNEIVSAFMTRKVILRDGCRVEFTINESLTIYGVCVDLWRIMNRDGTVISKV